MKFLVLIFVIVVLNIKALSQFASLESSDFKDIILESNFEGNVLNYYKFIELFHSQDSLNENNIESGILGHYDLNTKEAVRTPIYSNVDSINYIILIVKDNNDVHYTLRLFKNSLSDTNPLYFLEKRTEDLSTVLESTQLTIDAYIDRIFSGFFDENNILQIKGFQVLPFYATYYYSFDDQFDITTTFSENNIEDGYMQEVNDSTYVSCSRNLSTVVYMNKDFTIRRQVNGQYLFFIDEKTILMDSVLYFSGIRLSFGKREYVIYQHKINSDTCNLVYVDTMAYNTEVRRAYRSLAITDTNYIYGGSNYYDCNGLFNNSCDSWFQIYCVSSQGQLHWSKKIGENDGYNLLMELHATPDTGCLALFYRYTEEDSAKNGDFYWLKYDKQGNADTTYLKGFDFGTYSPPVFSDVTVYPNPTRGLVSFQFPTTISQPEITLYDVFGRYIFKKNIVGSQLDISNLSNGTYVYQINDNNQLITYGKLVKQ